MKNLLKVVLVAGGIFVMIFLVWFVSSIKEMMNTPRYMKDQKMILSEEMLKDHLPSSTDEDDREPCIYDSPGEAIRSETLVTKDSDWPDKIGKEIIRFRQNDREYIIFGKDGGLYSYLFRTEKDSYSKPLKKTSTDLSFLDNDPFIFTENEEVAMYLEMGLGNGTTQYFNHGKRIYYGCTLGDYVDRMTVMGLKPNIMPIEIENEKYNFWYFEDLPLAEKIEADDSGTKEVTYPEMAAYFEIEIEGQE